MNLLTFFQIICQKIKKINLKILSINLFKNFPAVIEFMSRRSDNSFSCSVCQETQYLKTSHILFFCKKRKGNET